MMKFSTGVNLMALLVVSSLPARAQPSTVPQPTRPPKVQEPQRILYNWNVPSVMRRLMPRGAKTRFYGTFRLKSNGPQYALHLYEPRGISKNREYPTYIFRLVVYQAQTRRGRTLWLHLSTTPLRYSGLWLTRSDQLKFGAQLLWLDPDQQTQPILLLKYFRLYTEGPMGNEILIVFAHDLRRQIITQDFGYGDWISSNSTGTHNEFDYSDEKGLLMVKTTVLPAVIEPYQVIWHRWNGQKFVASAPISVPQY